MPLLRPVPRPRRGVAAALAAAGAVALLLSGCTGGAPAASPSPSADAAEPIFATDEEALAAAVEAYEAYMAVDAQIGEDGGSDPERILGVVSEEYSLDVIAEYEDLADHGYKVTGTSTIDTTSLVEKAGNESHAVVTIYACVGVGTTRIIDAGGIDITPVNRDPETPLVLVFAGTNADELKLTRSDLWTGSDFC